MLRGTQRISQRICVPFHPAVRSMATLLCGQADRAAILTVTAAAAAANTKIGHDAVPAGMCCSTSESGPPSVHTRAYEATPCSSNTAPSPPLTPGPTTGLPFQATVGLALPGDVTVYGSGAAATALALGAAHPKKKAAPLAGNDSRVVEWVAWAEALAPHANAVAQASEATGLPFPEAAGTDAELLNSWGILAAAVEQAVAALAGNAGGKGKTLVGAKLSLADIAVGAVFWPLADARGCAGAWVEGTWPELSVWLANMFASPAFKAGIPAARSALAIAPVPLSFKLADVDPKKTIRDELAALFAQATAASTPDIEGVDVKINTISKSGCKAHFETNVAMQVFGRLKSAAKSSKQPLPEGMKSPQAVAAAIIAALPANDFVEDVQVQGPGFITLNCQAGYLTARTRSLAAHGPTAARCDRKRVVVDYSSPNIAKDMHVGHLRSTIIGDCLSRVLEEAGHEVLRVNHVGDWGTQFGMLIAHLKDKYPDAATNPPPIQDLTAFYKESKVRFDGEEGFKARAHTEVVALQAGNEENLALWKTLCAVSERMLNEMYERLGVSKKLAVTGESFYNPMLPGLVVELGDKGLLKDEDGARVIFPEGSAVPLIIRKRDGGFGYDSTDMAALKYRVQDLGADWLFYVVDAGQSLHFELVFKAAQAAGFWSPTKQRVEHVGFGLVQGEDRKRLKTRSGDTVRLIDLLDEARDRMSARLHERVDAGTSSELGDLEVLAERIGTSAVKYFDLRQNRATDYVFNYDRMLAFEGDTAVYLQYAHARVSSVLAKALSMGNTSLEETLAEFKSNPELLTLSHPSELGLAMQLGRYAEVIEDVQGDLCPHHVCGLMQRIASAFSEFYRDCRIVEGIPPAEVTVDKSRLLLVHVTGVMLRKLFSFMGVEPVERL